MPRALLPIVSPELQKRRFVHRPPMTSPAEALRKANEIAIGLFHKGEVAEACKIFEGLEKVLPDHPDVLSGLSTCYMHLGRNSEALKTLSRARLANPDDANIAGSLMRLYLHMGEPRSATSIGKALLRQPNRDGRLDALISECDSAARGIKPMEVPAGFKILFVAEPASIHSARWINQLDNRPWEIHVTSGQPESSSIRPEFRVGTVHTQSVTQAPQGVIVQPLSPLGPSGAPAQLAELITRVKPDLIHSLGLCVDWKNRCLPVAQALALCDPGRTIPWLYSSWGADLELYGLTLANADEMRTVFDRVDFLLSECHRDRALATQFGFHGQFMGYLPAHGGVDWDTSASAQKPPSRRRTIVLKGRDTRDGDPQGRAMNALFALLASEDVCRHYRLVVLQAGECVRRLAMNLKTIGTLDVEVPPPVLPHQEVLQILASARVAMGITAFDGLPSFLVEAMSMGAFPIHSDLSPIREWINDGYNGLLVDPEDPISVSQALRRALTDDALVDHAASINAGIVNAQLGFDRVKEQTLAVYGAIWKRSANRQQK